MTPSKAVKEAGLKSMIEASEIANKPRRTLERNFYSNKQYFDVIIAGCVVVKNRGLNE